MRHNCGSFFIPLDEAISFGVNFLLVKNWVRIYAVDYTKIKYRDENYVKQALYYDVMQAITPKSGIGMKIV